MPQKKKKALGDIFSSTPALMDESAPGAMDSLFDTYYEPSFARRSDGKRPVDTSGMSFPDAVEEESAALADDLDEADRVMTQRFKEAGKAVGSGVDFNYFTCITFVSEEQCQAFIEAMGWGKYTDGTVTYINGVLLAKDLGITLPEGYLAGVGRKKAK